MSDKHAHLEMIQGIINRLSQNSFLLKGWSIILISAMFALAANDARIWFVYVAYFPAIILWLLDGYFLRKERIYRELYEYVRQLPDELIDYSMKTGIVENQVKPYICVAFSKTLLTFHGVIIGTIILVTIISICLISGGL